MELRDRSKVVREAYARQHLSGVLFWAFASPDRQSDEELLERIVPTVVAAMSIESGWGPWEPFLREQGVRVVRGEVAQAFATIREIATAVASGEPTPRLPRLRVVPFLLDQSWDHLYDGRPLWGLHARLRDALIWTTLRLFSEVPRSLIRHCAFQDCPRIMVASRNQKHCTDHAKEAARLAHRRAEKAFRARQRKKKKRRKA